MSNFNLVQTRTTSLNKIPRLTFQLPNQPDSVTTQNQTPIFFCQTGCQIDFKFSNINSCSIYNDGNYFSITPVNDNNQNYVLWNGSNVNGQEMTPFYLKEIYFSAPAKDQVGNITYNQTIQYYFAFVNESYNNLMIIVSVIGQVNNLGNNAITNGFTFLQTLAPQIPLKGDDVTLNNLSNFNVGTLLPGNKSFFSTLINDNNVQYIIMTKIIDIPIEFFNNMVSKVVGSTASFSSKVANFMQNTPVNPPGTIIFFNENIQPIGSGDALVCDANCSRVPGKASQLSPQIGGRVTRQIEPSERTDDYIKSMATQEECEMEEVWPGDETNVSPIKQTETKSFIDTIFIILTVFFMLVLITIVTFEAYNRTAVDAIGFLGKLKAFFVSNWKVTLGWSIAFLAVVICYSVGVSWFANKNESETKKKKWWVWYLVGIIIYIIPTILIARGGDFGKMMTTLPGVAPGLGAKLGSMIPSFGMGATAPPINFSDMFSKLDTTKFNPQSYKDLQASFAKLPQYQRQILKKSFGPLFTPGSQISKSLLSPKPDKSALSALQSGIDRYKKVATITPKFRDDVYDLYKMNPTNPNLKGLYDDIVTKNDGDVLDPLGYSYALDFASKK